MSSTPPPAPRLPKYAHAAASVAVTHIASEASASQTDSARFEAIERSASEVLLDIFTRYMRSLGTATRAAAQHASRSQCNVADMLVGLRSVHAGTAGMRTAELLAFLADAPEGALPVGSAFPAPRDAAVLATAGAVGDTDAAPPVVAEPRPAHLPDFLPPLPEKRTYMQTATYSPRPSDGAAAKKKRSKHRRQAQDSLFALTELERGRSAGANAGLATAAPPLPPPPPLPTMPPEDAHEHATEEEAARETAAEERAAADSLRRHDGILAMSRFPDVLIPGQPAVLQSSAHSESSGIVAPFGSACSGSDGAAAAAAAPALDARPLQDAHKKILGLKHLHGLDGAETGNAGDD